MATPNIAEAELNAIAREVFDSSSDVLAVMVRGSYVRRTMTTTSDIDLYAVTRREGPSAEFRHRGSNLFHIRFTPLSHLLWELRRCEPRYFGFVHDGRPIIDPSGIFQLLEAAIESLPAQETLQRIPSEGRHQHDDAEGQFAAGNFRSAVQLAREAATAYLCAFLLANGVKCFKKKDVLNDLEQLNTADDLKCTYWRLMGLSTANRQTAENALRDADSLFKYVDGHVRTHFGYGILESPATSW